MKNEHHYLWLQTLWLGVGMVIWHGHHHRLCKMKHKLYVIGQTGPKIERGLPASQGRTENRREKSQRGYGAGGTPQRDAQGGKGKDP